MTKLMFSLAPIPPMKCRCGFNRFCVPSIRQFEKNLGLSALVGRAKKQSFIYIKERVWKKLQGWKEKLLSQAGREVLIKSII